MSDDVEMTPAERAQAYEVEAARLVDRVTRRGYQGSHEATDEAVKLVKLIVEAAVCRVNTAAAPRTDER